jgi:hypothetical protein
MFIFWIQQARKHLAVVNIGSCNSISADESIVNIDAFAVFVAVVIDAIFLSPASIKILFSKRSCFSSQPSGQG